MGSLRAPTVVARTRLLTYQPSAHPPERQTPPARARTYTTHTHKSHVHTRDHKHKSHASTPAHAQTAAVHSLTRSGRTSTSCRSPATASVSTPAASQSRLSCGPPLCHNGPTESAGWVRTMVLDALRERTNIFPWSISTGGNEAQNLCPPRVCVPNLIRGDC